MDFEDYDPSRPVDAIVASRSLHHVRDVDEVLDRAAVALRPGGAIVVLEWAWERFDEPTARWCFDRLDPSPAEDPAGCSGDGTGGWPREGPGARTSRTGQGSTASTAATGCVAGLDARFERTSCDYAPYFFADLADSSEEAEQAAIDAGEIRATGIRYAGRLREI